MEGLVLVSSRLPVAIRVLRSGEQTLARTAGGLVAGLEPLHKRGAVWVGYPGEDPNPKVTRALARRRLIPVAVPPSEYRGYYLGYSNSAIWPLFHYMIDRCGFRPDAFRAYRTVNERFAEVVLDHVRKDGTLWIHDYQLMLLPRMLRERRPDIRIGFFLHIPFPSAEVFRVLPQREEILRGLLGADLIGVHTHDYAQNLANSMRRFLGLEVREGSMRLGGRRIRIQAQALGVDVKRLREVAYSGRADRQLKALRRSFRGRKVILGVDRLDYTKGLPLKLGAFRCFLESSEAWRGRAVMVQLAIPTRGGIDSYRQQREEVERLVGEINGMHGTPGRMPVHYLYRSVPPEDLGALYRLADVCLVTPLRDGLNLVAKEYVACHESGGTLVLSEFAGAASELGEAIRVNPWDTEGTADAIARALAMDPAERRDRMSAMHRRVAANDVDHWAGSFLRSLSEPSERGYHGAPLLEPDTLSTTIGPEFGMARRALLLIDYDGTLSEFNDRYEDATPASQIRALLKKLGTLDGVEVFIISGRDRDILGAWLGDLRLSIVAEHGAWLRRRDSSKWVSLGRHTSANWKGRVLQIMQDYTARTPGSRIEEKSTSVVWHYRQAPIELGNWQALQLTSLLEQMLAQSPAEVVAGAMNVEVIDQGVGKGPAAMAVIEEFGPFDFILAAGDDKTDESVFASLGTGAFSVRVGTGETNARAVLDSPAAMRRLLNTLADERMARGGDRRQI